MSSLGCFFGRRVGLQLSAGLTFLSANGLAQGATLAGGDPATTLNLKTFTDGLDQPTDIAPLDDGRAVITQRLGDVVVVTKAGDQVTAGHITVHILNGEQGLLGVVADPSFKTNHYLYFFASAGTPADGTDHGKVYKLTLGDDNKISAVSAASTLIDKGIYDPLNHNGGGLIIYNNQLYISVGDSGANSTPPVNRLSTCLNSPNGKILRINLDGSIPDDNPLSKLDMVTGCTITNGVPVRTGAFSMQPPDKRVFAWGLRNPFRFWVDPKTGLLWIGDVGESTREEFDVGPGGKHYGYPFEEGTVKYTKAQQPFQPDNTCEGITPASECVPPQYDYPHTNGNNAIVGGRILDGCGWPAPWNARYIFGDNGGGHMWTADVKPDRSGAVANSIKDFGTATSPAAFRIGFDGALYVVEVGGGSVQKITPKNPTTITCAPTMGGTGGSGGNGGTASGGRSNGGAAEGGAAEGGAVSAGASNGGSSSGGLPGSGSTPSSDSGACGCKLGAAPHNASGLGLLGLLGVARGRRRARRSRKRS